jgi:hypothetical protein
MAACEPMGTGGWSHELALFCPDFRLDSIFNTGYQAWLNIKPPSLLIFVVFNRISIASFTMRSMYPVALSNTEVLLKSIRC